MNIILIVCAGTCVRLTLRQCFPSGVPGLIRRANSWAPDLLCQRLQRQSAVACVLFSSLFQWFWSILELENPCSVQAHLTCASPDVAFFPHWGQDPLPTKGLQLACIVITLLITVVLTWTGSICLACGYLIALSKSGSLQDGRTSLYTHRGVAIPLQYIASGYCQFLHGDDWRSSARLTPTLINDPAHSSGLTSLIFLKLFFRDIIPCFRNLSSFTLDGITPFYKYLFMPGSWGVFSEPHKYSYSYFTPLRQHFGYEFRMETQVSWVWVPAPPLNSCITVDIY